MKDLNQLEKELRSVPLDSGKGEAVKYVLQGIHKATSEIPNDKELGSSIRKFLYSIVGHYK